MPGGTECGGVLARDFTEFPQPPELSTRNLPPPPPPATTMSSLALLPCYTARQRKPTLACQEKVRSHSDAISAGAVTANSRTSMATSGVRGEQDSETLPSQGLLRFGWVRLGLQLRKGKRVREPNLTQSHAGSSVLLTSCLRNFGTASLSLSLSLPP